MELGAAASDALLSGMQQAGTAVGSASRRASGAASSTAYTAGSLAAPPLAALGSYASQSLQNNVRDTLAVGGQLISGMQAATPIVAAGMGQTAALAGQGAVAVGRGVGRTLAIAGPAAANAAVAGLKYAGPPIVHGAYVAAQLGAQGVGAAASQVPGAMRALGDAAGRGVDFARSRLGKAQLSLADIYDALEATSSLEPTNELVPFSEELALPGLEDRRGIGNRASTPTRRRNVSKQPPLIEPAMPAAKPEVSFETATEWVHHSKNKTELVEQLYRRPGWQHLLRVTGSVDLRKKLSKLSNLGLAQLIVKLDHP